MIFTLEYSITADEALNYLEVHNTSKYQKVTKALGLMETNIRYQGLHTHEYNGYVGPSGEKVFEAYVENDTPGAWRIFFCYASGKRGVIYIIAITDHP